MLQWIRERPRVILQRLLSFPSYLGSALLLSVFVSCDNAQFAILASAALILDAKLRLCKKAGDLLAVQAFRW